MIKKTEMKKAVRKSMVRKTSKREPKRRTHAVPEARTYVSEQHWELW